MFIRAILFVSAALCMEKSSYIVMFDGDPYMHRMYANTLYATNVMETERMLQPDEMIEAKMSNGYMAYMSENTANRVREHPNVKVVEKDSPVYISGFKKKGLLGRIGMEKIRIQRHAPWGLARVGGSVSLAHGTYRYPLNSGRGVDIYILDTGVEITHPEFGGRAKWGANFVPGSPDKDEHGHGTHCAGIAGGKNFGITKKSNIVAVKILDKYGTGMISRLLQGIDFVIGEHERKKDEMYSSAASKYLVPEDVDLVEIEAEDPEGLPLFQMRRSWNLADFSKNMLLPKTVINLSVGGFKSAALNFAIEYASRLGIHFSMAAGNEHEDACDFSPSSSKVGITTGASTYKDTIAFFSNFGDCVDIFAPGVDILSSWIGGTQKVASGTSMATPHTTGVMAAYLTYYEYDPEALKRHILKDAYNVIDNSTSAEELDLSGLWHLPSLFRDPKRKLPMLSIEKLLKKIRR